MRRCSIRPLVLVTLLGLTARPALADSSALILSGVAGSDEHSQRFSKWTESTKKLLVDQFAFSPDRVLVLADKAANREGIRSAFATLKGQIKPQDTFFLFLIGHGSYEGTEYRFNISGPDLTGSEYAALLSSLGPARMVVVNGTSASGGAVEKLAGRNRVIVSATRSGLEGNETIFYEHFLSALTAGAADEDKDRKISVWEAFRYASLGVERFYKEQNRLATEHPQLSDNGNAQVAATAKEIPNIARSTVFQVDRIAEVADPQLRALLEQRRQLELRVEQLRLDKDGMPPAEYEKRMEDLLVELALKNQQIREQEKRK